MIAPSFVQRHREWQSNVIYEPKRHKNLKKREVRDLRKQISARQNRLEVAVRGGSSVLALHLRETLRVPTALPFTPAPLAMKFSSADFKNPTLELERDLTDGWTGVVTRQLASQPAYWVTSLITWLEDNLLPLDLDQMLLVGQKRSTKQALLEHQTRNLIRRTGGIDVVRGHVSVLSECPTSRAWWRRRIAEEAAEASEGDLDSLTAHRVLHADNSEWESFAVDSLRRIPVSNHSRLRAAVICQFPDAVRLGAGVEGKPQLQLVARELARYGPTASLQHIPWHELLDIASVAKERISGGRLA